MKKSLILVGLLSIGYAHAQQYDGKVGVNTETPSATLNVKSKTGTNGGTKNFELENADGTKMVTVLDNGNVGIGNANPKYILDIASSSNDYYRNSIAIRTARDYQGSSGIDIYRSKGTVPNPEALHLGDFMSRINTFGYTGSKYKLTSSITSIVTGEVSGDHIETSMMFNVFGENKQTENPQLLIHHTGNIGIGLGVNRIELGIHKYVPNEPTHRLHVKSDSNPIRLEGLQASTEVADKVVVVDASGVLKTVERASIGGGSQGLTSEVDGVIGNEVSDVIANGGLKVEGSGTSTSPLKVGIKEGGVIGTMLANGSVTGEKLAPSSVDAGKIAPNAVTGDKIANATIGADKLNIPGQADQVLTYKNGGWVASALPSAPVEVDGIVGNEVTGVIENRGLVREGQGTQTSPYKVGLLPGTKVGQTLVWNGSAWEAKEATPASEGTFTRNFREDNGSSITVNDTDYFIYLTGNVTSVSLPQPSASNKGRIICLQNSGNSTGKITPQPVGQQQSIEPSQTSCYISSGTKWVNSTGY